MFESRKYSALAFCAFKDFPACFFVVLEHGKKHNLKKSNGVDVDEDELSRWADMCTDEHFTAIHFATYHANLTIIKCLVE